MLVHRLHCDGTPLLSLGGQATGLTGFYAPEPLVALDSGRIGIWDRVKERLLVVDSIGAPVGTKSIRVSVTGDGLVRGFGYLGRELVAWTEHIPSQGTGVTEAATAIRRVGLAGLADTIRKLSGTQVLLRQDSAAQFVFEAPFPTRRVILAAPNGCSNLGDPRPGVGRFTPRDLGK